MRKLRKALPVLASYLFILLFVYAAVSKLLDFETFKIQLGQSPLLTAFAGWTVWLVSLAELITILALLVPKFRLLAVAGILLESDISTKQENDIKQYIKN